jgi:hypothetical protein
MEIHSIEEEIRRKVPSCLFVELGSQSVAKRPFVAQENDVKNKQ